MKFELEVRLGNDAMRDGLDVAELLREVADKLDGAELRSGNYGNLLDLNGNTVGGWAVS